MASDLTLRDIEAAEAKGGLLALRAATPEVLADARKMLAQIEAAAALAAFHRTLLASSEANCRLSPAV